MWQDRLLLLPCVLPRALTSSLPPSSSLRSMSDSCELNATAPITRTPFLGLPLRA